MGSGASLPEGIDKAKAQELVGDKFSEDAFAGIATEGTVARDDALKWAKDNSFDIVEVATAEESNSTPDPWVGVDADALFSNCTADDSIFKLLQVEDTLGGLEMFWTELDKKLKNEVLEPLDIGASELQLIMLHCDGIEDAESVAPERACRESVFRFEFSNASSLQKAGPFLKNWWRVMSLSGCNLSGGVDGKGLEVLLHLDLSFSEVDLEKFSTAGLENLRFLALEGCSLESLVEDSEGPHWLSNLLSLEELNISDNDLDESDGIQPLKHLATVGRRRRFLTLDMRENALVEEIGRQKYTALLHENLFPAPNYNLHMLDNKKLQEDTSALTKGLHEINGLAQALGRKDTVMDQNEFRESCSCLEGNPCTNKYNCVDWANREAVAAGVRKRKGMSDIWVTGGV